MKAFFPGAPQQFPQNFTHYAQPQHPAPVNVPPGGSANPYSKSPGQQYMRPSGAYQQGYQ